MKVIGKKEGYGFLIKWIVFLGDLICINLFFIVLCNILESLSLYEQLGQFNVLEFFLLINFAYFITINIVPPNLFSNIVFFEKIIQRAASFITVYAIILTVGISLFNDITMPWYVWICSYLSLYLFFSLWHIVFRSILKAYRKKGLNFKRVVIVGAGLNGMNVYYELSSRVYGYKIMGIFDDNESLKYTLADYKGSTSLVEDFCLENNVDEVYCTLPGNQEEKILQLLNFSEKNMIRFYLVPEFYKYIKRKLVLNFLQSTPIIEIRTEPLQSLPNRILKRSFDIVFSALVLATVFPIVYVICGIIIKIQSPGPILFTQKRTGLHGKIFTCYKFRSMKLNLDADLLTTTKPDPRITKIGAFMRKTSLDELPQFINIIKGDMSVVGPRPHMIKQTEIYDKLINSFMIRHLIRPGLTGWAQISGYRGEIKTIKQMEGRFQADVWYIENWSFFLDIKIIFVTVYKVIFGDKDAY